MRQCGRRDDLREESTAQISATTPNHQVSVNPGATPPVDIALALVARRSALPPPAPLQALLDWLWAGRPIDCFVRTD
jgi:hypothetical protein